MKPHQHTVLLVDDDPHYLDLIELHLKLHHFRVLRAGSAEEAIGRLVHQVPDAVVCDVELPGANGVAFQRIARDTEAGSDVPFVFTTGFVICSDDIGEGHAVVRKAEGPSRVREEIERALRPAAA